MRVIAGSLRGRPLRAPRGRDVRPTSDRVREALFSVLASDVVGARVLDLFAGSGALAIEALSRGAASADCVDVSAAAVGCIKRNLVDLGLSAEVHRQPAGTFLAWARSAGRQYDLVFLDPPYRLASAAGREFAAALPGVLAAQARVVAESDHRTPLPLDLPLGFERRYGDTLIRIHDSR